MLIIIIVTVIFISLTLYMIYLYRNDINKSNAIQKASEEDMKIWYKYTYLKNSFENKNNDTDTNDTNNTINHV